MKLIKSAFGIASRLATLDRRIEESKMLQGRILANQHRQADFGDLSDYEFKVFSQWGEDGIIQHLVQSLGIENRTFIEFGVEDFSESNCRFLMMKDGWQGFVIDGSEGNVDRLQSSYYFWRYPLTARCSFVTRENVSRLLDESGFGRRVGLLSIDVDGVDWYLLSELAAWDASIIVVEYNSLFGSTRQVSVPYDPQFIRGRAHYSNLYYGASLPAFATLLNDRGYALVGSNAAGSNAFFVQRRLLNSRIREAGIEACFRRSLFREARNSAGELLLKSAVECGGMIASLPLVDTATGETLRVADVL